MTKNLKRKISKKLDTLQEFLSQIDEARIINPDDPDTWDSDTLYSLTELPSNESSFNHERQLTNPPQEIPQSFTTDWGGIGFVLEPINHWITFTVWPNKIRVFYKEVKPNPADLWDKEIITYYQKDLPKQEVVSFTFTP